MKRYGVIRTFINGFSQSGEINISKNCRSFTLANQGTTTAHIELNGNNFNLDAGKSVTFGGYDDSVRDDQLKVTFSGAGTNALKLFQDIILKQPNFIGNSE